MFFSKTFSLRNIREADISTNREKWDSQLIVILMVKHQAGHPKGSSAGCNISSKASSPSGILTMRKIRARYNFGPLACCTHCWKKDDFPACPLHSVVTKLGLSPTHHLDRTPLLQKSVTKSCLFLLPLCSVSC